MGGLAMMVLYQCSKCGREAEIAGFIKKVTVICPCGYTMEKVMTTNRKMDRKRYIQLKLFG
jgi:DNA-directed RNA polymerase subunit RPC12/RpoP